MKAVILSCGLGERLRHLGYKALLGLQGRRALIVRTIDELKAGGIDQITVMMRPENRELQEVVGSSCDCRYAETPNPFATLQAYIDTLSPSSCQGWFVVCASDLVFPDRELRRLVQQVQVAEVQTRLGDVCLLVTPSPRGIGVAVSSPSSDSSVSQVRAIGVPSPVVFGDLSLIRGEELTRLRAEPPQRFPKIIEYLKIRHQAGLRCSAITGRVMDVDTEADLPSAEDLISGGPSPAKI